MTTRTPTDWLVARAVARKQDEAREAYQRAQMTLFVALEGRAPRKTLETALSLVARRRAALLAAEMGR